jgi:hypothetical protein
MVMDLDRATFSNIEHLSQEFVTFTLMPYLTRIEASVSKWLLKPAERAKYFLRFNVEGLLRADSASRAAFYATAVQNGYMNRNEVRAKENLNAVAGLDEYTAQTNLAPVQQLGALAARNSQPQQPPQQEKAATMPQAVLPQALTVVLEERRAERATSDSDEPPMSRPGKRAVRAV